jgi:hypothetical protein
MGDFYKSAARTAEILNLMKETGFDFSKVETFELDFKEIKATNPEEFVIQPIIKITFYETRTGGGFVPAKPPRK